ncbi:BREX-2 system adenine-specific DNA-methyltransferase PglX [Streptomyces sp. NPDC048560]|uniref:BREX-2 system adenine-specific DNA-methyltransferase PglX n=1 Tax=Streptomyces sp. NPDC048560 TaxID=3155488 RepID=UPI0034370A2E
MIDRAALLKDLQRQVKTLETDLRQQVTAVEETYTRLRAEYDKAFKLKRTAAAWGAWRDERVTQAAAAWVLGTVFVRFCEDNGLLGNRGFLAGPDEERMTLAEEAQAQFYRDHQGNQTDRGWLLAAFEEMSKAQAGSLLFDRRHNALYQIPLSHDAAKSLITFWRRCDEQGTLVHDFTDDNWDTRFLGDLYQDLSESARKTYALLQTPEFVEEFILDRTLTPAINEFGHETVKMIDPTCGSGHFLLGAFWRLLSEWDRNAPGRGPRERVKLALDAVHGVDINPFAAAIARFRLVIAALRAADFKNLDEAAGYRFPVHVAVGDALIKAREFTLPGFEDLGGETDELAEFQYATEDLSDHYPILREGRYHVVVGNPPYIQVKDKNLNQIYRDLYSACAGSYALSVPFAQRFFHLAREADKHGKGAGFVGQITANSFMKREFGRKLITEFFSLKAELSEIIDTSGAYIPGHGTPTVILIGRRRTHHFHSPTVRTILGVKGEPGVPIKAAEGQVWQAILRQIDQPGRESEWISSVDAKRSAYSTYPWSLSGGGAKDLEESLRVSSTLPLGKIVESVGRTTSTGEDDLYFLPNLQTARRLKNSEYVRELVVGDSVRDFSANTSVWVRNPYEDQQNKEPILESHPLAKDLWIARTLLGRRLIFGKTMIENGRPWPSHLENYSSKLKTPLAITFAFVATHNHFAFDREGRLFNRTAPMIKLQEGATEEDHLGLLGILNSSTACFWLKQVSQGKGGSGLGRGVQDEEWEERYEFTGTKLQEFPLPTEYPTSLAAELDRLAQSVAKLLPFAATAPAAPLRSQLEADHASYHSARARMIALQEELDWHVYSAYDLVDTLHLPADSVPDINLGERAFEIELARRMARGEIETQWFSRHGSAPITELPDHWSEEYKEVVSKRIEIIEANRAIGLIERPECKRRWAAESWDTMQARALRTWLLDRTEARDLWFHEVDGMEQPKLLTAAELADALALDADFVSVAELYAPGKDLGKLVAELVTDEHVPFLATLRYKEAGLRKRADWEHMWDEQRREDAAETEEKQNAIRDTIGAPPRYAAADFLKPSYWRNRGKLDVPKERFISYPYASRDGDSSLLLGWAGWDHREQAQALSTLIVEREAHDGWGSERLTPLLAGLREALPWVHQWHSDFDVTYGDSPASVYAGFLVETTNRLRLTNAALTSWRAPQKGGRGRQPS